MTGHWVMASFHAIAAGYARAGYLPEAGAEVYKAYEEYVAKMKTPAAERYLELHIGHCTYVALLEQKYVTPETIAATTMIGAKEELVSRTAASDGARGPVAGVHQSADGRLQRLHRRQISRDVIARM